MAEIPKIISHFFEMFNPQRDMDLQTTVIIKAKISQKVREELLGETTRAKIIYGYVNQVITILAIALGIFWTVIYWIR